MRYCISSLLTFVLKTKFARVASNSISYDPRSANANGGGKAVRVKPPPDLLVLNSYAPSDEITVRTNGSSSCNNEMPLNFSESQSITRRRIVEGCVIKS